METMKSKILCQKLSFLHSLLQEDATGVGAAVMKSLSDDMKSLCLVKECCELESTYGTNFTKDLLIDNNCVFKCIIRKTVCGIDRDRLVLKCFTKSSFIAWVVERGGGWPKLWDSHPISWFQAHYWPAEPLQVNESPWKRPAPLPTMQSEEPTSPHH